MKRRGFFKTLACLPLGGLFGRLVKAVGPKHAEPCGDVCCGVGVDPYGADPCSPEPSGWTVTLTDLNADGHCILDEWFVPAGRPNVAMVRRSRQTIRVGRVYPVEDVIEQWERTRRCA